MEYIYIGNIVNTHGIKGELRILSDFKHKDLVFQPDFHLYIGPNKIDEKITGYRKHKNFDMVTFGYNNINQVLKYKNQPVYVKKNDLNVPYLNEDLIGFIVFDTRLNREIGNLKEILTTNLNEILELDNKILIPNIEQFVKQIDVENKKIIVETIRGMVDED